MNRKKLGNCGIAMSRPLKTWSLGSTVVLRRPACWHCLWGLSLVAASRVPCLHARRFVSRPVSSPKQSSLQLGSDFWNIDNIKKTVSKYLGSEKDYAAILRSQPSYGNHPDTSALFLSNSSFLQMTSLLPSAIGGLCISLPPNGEYR